MFLDAQGQPAALKDRCCHRTAKLSKGFVEGDHIVCGYHGLTFDTSGTCIAAPTQATPPKACVRSYPLAERYGLVWIWMGDPAQADPAKIIDIPQWGSPDWGYNRGPVIHVDCHYLYVVDNLLDPTHVTWVHPGSFGDASCAAVPIETTSRADGVTAARWLMDTQPAPFYAKFLRFAGRADRYQHYEMRYPSNAVIKAVFTPAGTGGFVINGTKRFITAAGRADGPGPTLQIFDAQGGALTFILARRVGEAFTAKGVDPAPLRDFLITEGALP